MANSPVTSVSQADIEDRLIAYFVAKFAAASMSILTSTDLKQRFNYNTNAWANFANTLTAMAWMKQIRVRLAPPEMADATTLLQLSDLIWKKVPKLVGGTGALVIMEASDVAPARRLAKKKPSKKRGQKPKRGAGRKRTNG